MKFINYLTGIAGVEIYPLISLLVFFTFFTVLTIYLFRADKSHIKYMSQLPVEANETKTTNDQDL